MMSVSKEEQDVKNSIKALLTSSPCVSTMKSLHKEYMDLIGESIPYAKFDYKSLEHFLKSIPDVCTVRGCGWYAELQPVVTENIAHINEMVTRQKFTSKRKDFQPRRRHTTINSSTFRGNNGFNMNFNRQFGVNNIQGHTTTGVASTWHPTKTTTAAAMNTSTRTTTTFSAPTTAAATTTTRTSTTTAAATKTTAATTITRTYPTFNATTTTASSTANGVSKFYSMPFRPNESITNNQTTLSCQPQFQTHQTRDTVKQDRGDPVRTFTQANLKREESQSAYISFETVRETVNEDTSNVPQKVQDHLKTLIAKFPDGIWASDLPATYMKLFKRVLLYKDYGYVNLVDMCIALSNIFHYIRPGHDDFKLFDKNKPFPASAEKFWTISSCSDVPKMSTHMRPLPDLDWSDIKGRFPNDIFAYGEVIPSQFLPEGTKIDGILDVVVVEIYDPSKFWFYLGSSVEKTPLDALMDQLQYFYNDGSNVQEYAIPQVVVKEGLYCVQIIVGEYHRAKVVKVLPEEESVRLLFIDYGTVCKVPMKGLCFLRTEFAVLPAQAIRCRLANIAPREKGITWSRTAVDRFREMINRKDTKIKISYIDWQEEFVCVFLADVTDPDNVHYVNDKLVKENLAVWCGEKQLNPFAIPIFKSKVQNLHLFPTYLELEYGLAPNTNEMYYLQEMLVPLQFCIPQYFEPIPKVLKDFESDRKSLENSFYKSVKRNHRRYIPLNTRMSDMVTKSTKVDLSIFGQLRDKIAQLCTAVELSSTENAISKKAVDGFSIVKNKRSFASLQLCQNNREISEKIISMLEDLNTSDPGLDLDCPPVISRISSTFSENSSSSQNDNTTFSLPVTDQSKTFCFNEVPNESDLFSPRCSDLNVFDNPGAFCDEDSASNDQAFRNSDSSVSPDSFFSMLQSKVDNDYFKDTFDDCKEDKITQSTDTFGFGSLKSTNPFREFLFGSDERATSWETDLSSNHELNLEGAVSHSQSLETLLSSKSDYKEFVPRFKESPIRANSESNDVAEDVPEIGEPPNTVFIVPVDSVSQKQGSEIYESASQELTPVSTNGSHRGSTDRYLNETPRPPNNVFPTAMSYVTQMVESESCTSVSQVQLSPMAFTHYPQWSDGSNFPPMPHYPQWSDGSNYSAPYPVMFGSKTRPPPGFMPMPCQVGYSHQQIATNNVRSGPFYPNMPLVMGYGPPAPMDARFFPMPATQPDFYTRYNPRF